MHASAQEPDAWFATYPALTPDGNTVIFSYEGDLWKASVKDGQAVRLTAMQGYETNARVSPDGKWIAFTSRQLGNPDVYVMPVDGGDIRQLTYHDATDEVDGWSWDSQTNGSKVVFERDYQLYLYDVASKNASKLNIKLVRNNVFAATAKLHHQ